MASQYQILTFSNWINNNQDRFNNNPEFSSLGPSVFEYLKKLKPSVQTVIIEHEYIDPDYTSAFKHFYSSLFHPPARTCTRFLFFNKSFKSIHSLKTGKVVKSFQGFIVVWPTDPPVIGRSALPYPDGDPQAHEHIKVSYECHVAGTTLSIETAMFASKDHGVSACATIATWLASDLMHRRYKTRTCSSAEITLLATGKDPKWGRPLPQVYGLDIQQITKALSDLDYAPYIYYISPDLRSPTIKFNTWIGVLYGYISSSIPMILLCNVKERGHAIIATGIEKKLQLPNESQAKGITGSKSFARSVKKILIHDDRFGAFGEILPDKYGSPMVNVHYENGYITPMEITALVAPLPLGVNLLSGESHRLGIRYLRKHIAKMAKVPEYNGPFRTRLRRSSEFKKEMHDWPANYNKLASRLRKVAMPDWIWVTEAFLEDDKPFDSKYAFARAILDAGQLRFNTNDIYVGGHFHHTFLP